MSLFNLRNVLPVVVAFVFGLSAVLSVGTVAAPAAPVTFSTTEVVEEVAASEPLEEVVEEALPVEEASAEQPTGAEETLPPAEEVVPVEEAPEASIDDPVGVGEILGESAEEVPTEEPVIEDSVPEVTSEAVVEESSTGDSPAEEAVAPEPAAEAEIAAPELTTEKADYHPGETATIIGKLFGSIQEIVLKIFGSDENDQNYVEEVQTITTDAEGNFTATYTLDDLYRPFYEMTASALDGTLLASGWFRDAAVDVYDQCSNDDGDGYDSDPGDCHWTNGNLQSNNSTYVEGDATVQRMSIKGFSPGQHSITFRYGTTKQGKHAYDYLTSWDWSEDWVEEVNRCDGIANCIGTSEDSHAFPDDPLVPNSIETFDAGTRNLVARGADITNISVPTVVSGDYTGDSETEVVVTFTVPQSGPMCTTEKVQGQDVTSCAVAMWFGAHIAEGALWNDFNGTTGAGSIAGSPYHVQLAALDGSSVGNRDNQMQANAIVVPENATLTLLKTVVNNNGGTALDTAWTLAANGPTPISGTEGSVAVTAAVVTPGQYTLSESGGPAGYTASQYSCSVNGGAPVVSNSITLAAGDDAVCTITNDDQQAYVTVVKVVTNDNGGTAQPNDFNLTLEGNAVTSGVAVPVNPGTYTAGETLLPGYSFSGFSGDCDSNGDVTVALGQSKTCTLTNNDNAPVLHLRKIIVNDNGGTATAADFTLTADGAGSNDLSGTSPVDSGAGLDADTFALSESVVPGYTASSWVCVGGTQNGANITLGLGQEAICTITNDDIAPQLTVIKHVVNDNGGTAVAGDFTMNVTATNPSDASFPGAEAPGTTITLNAGAYSVDESAFAGYAKSLGANCSGTIAVGESKTCTITNDDIAPKLILEKTVVNDNGGTAVEGDFQAKVDGNNVAWDAETTVTAGVHTASETTLPGYTAGVWGGDCAENGSVTLALGETKTCTITNDDQAGHLIVHKVTVPASDTTTQFSITAAGGTIVSPTATQSIVGGGSVDYTVNAGTYDVSEADLAGWDETGNTCTDVVVANGETKECTITNTKRGTITIVKDVIGNPDPTDFTFQNDFGNGHPASFMLDEDTNNTLPSSRSFEVLPGTYAVSEDALDGWQQESATCSDGSPIGAINVAPGETVTCTFVNEELVSITLVKNTIGGDGSFDFDATGTGLPADIDLSTVAGTATQTFTGLDQDDTFSIAENVPAGWALTSATCTGDETPESITPEPGEDVTCTFTNNKPAAQIDLTPLTATNAIGDDHVITADVQVHNGDGNYAPAADGTLVTFSITNSNGATAVFVGGDTCVTSGGTCSVTINSPTTGSVAIHASASPTVLGVAVPVATGTGGDNSADAQKDYVNARISITPLTDTNEVNDDHDFVVTVEEDTGSGFVALEGATVDVNVNPAVDSLDESDCTNGTDSSGQCTATINSDNAGVFTATANSTVNVNGVVFNLLTNALNGNSAAGVKTYVDASIALTPQEGTNNITDPHEITASVKKDEGSGLVAAVGETVTFSVTLGTAEFVGGVNTCVTDVLGTCSISIVDDTPGNNEVDASVSVTAGGLELARSTSGNAGPGGSDEAKKTYVAGALSVTKAIAGLAGVVNGNTVDDTFTVTVTGPSYPGGHQIVFTLTGGVLQNPNPVVLENLIPGNYTITEADAGTEWTETVPANAVPVVASQTADATVTNTYVPGSLEVSKVVDLNDYLFPQGVDTSFTFEVTGPSYPVAEQVVINVVDGVPAGAQTLQNLIPGNYTITEVGENTALWTASGEGAVNVIAGGTGQKAITNSLKIPNTEITITPSVFETEPGQNVVLTITDANNGEVPISNPSVELLANGVATNPQPSYVSGDTNTNSILDVGETWTWTIDQLIDVNTVFTANGKGTDPLGNPVEAPTYPGETENVTVRVIGTTRTIGFWQTHTDFTSNVFSLPAMQKYVGVNSVPVLGSHKGTITNVQSAGQSQLFGGFYAPIAQKSVGKGKAAKREPIDQARIQMLQQLLAAKLNCAAFGCSNAIQTLIVNADAAYAGTDKNLILSYAGQLDAFNNSGDAGAIPASLPATGKATPKASQALANLSFWDNP